MSTDKIPPTIPATILGTAADVAATSSDTRSSAGTPMPEPIRVARWANGDTFALGAVFFSIFAVVGSIIAIAFAARAISEAKNAASTASGAQSASVVELKEFSISPAQLDLTAGNARIQVNNVGTIGHNVNVEGLGTEVLDAGDEATLDLSSLPAGEYAIICTVPGHVDSGMTGTLTIR